MPTPQESMTAEQMAEALEFARHCARYPVVPEMSNAFEGKRADRMAAALLQRDAELSAALALLKVRDRDIAEQASTNVSINDLLEAALERVVEARVGVLEALLKQIREDAASGQCEFDVITAIDAAVPARERVIDLNDPDNADYR